MQFAIADPAWVLTTSDFKSQPADLQSITQESLQLTIAGQSNSLPFSRFLSLERATPPQIQPAKFLLHLTSGDILAGTPASLANDQLTWKSSLLGDMTIPLKQIQFIGRPAAVVAEGNRPQDIVILNNGDTLRVIIADISADKLSLQTDSDTTPVPIDSIAAIALATTSPSTQFSSLSTGLRLAFADGSLITARALTSSENSWSIALADNSTRSIDPAGVISIEQINGPVSWLSSRTPKEIIQLPYLGKAWPTRFDHSVTNQPITFDGKTFRHGIGVHSYSRITFALDGAYSTLRTQYAIDGDEPYADVTVRILLDGKVVHEQKDFRAGQLAPVAQIPLGSAKALTLEVDYGANHDTQDRFNWIEPALVK